MAFSAFHFSLSAPAWSATDTWITRASIPVTVANGGSLAYPGSGDTIYMMAGNSSPWFYAYSMSANTWTQKANTPANVDEGGALAYPGSGDTIYAMINNATNRMFAYSISGNTWDTKAATPYAGVARGGALVSTLNDTIYAFMGNTTKNFHSYSISTNTWDTKTFAPYNTNYGAQLVYPGSGDLIYAFVGTISSYLYTYSISGNTWDTKAATPAGLNAGGALVYPGSGNYLYAFRGATTTNFWRYSISGNTWETMAAVPGVVSFGGSLVYPGSGDTLYALQGNGGNFWAYTLPVYAGPNWYVNDASTSGDSWTSAVGSDTNEGSSSAPFRTIIKAIASAAAGDTIYIDAGTFDSCVHINGLNTETAGVNIDKDSITLVGKDSSSTIIDPQGANSTTNLYGIYADTQTGLRIQNIGVTGAYDGIHFYNVDNSAVTSDSCGSAGNKAIFLKAGSDNNRIQNSVFDNSSYAGIYLVSASSNAVSSNMARSDIYGIYVDDGCETNRIDSNVCNSNSQYGIVLNSCTGNLVTSNVANSNIFGGIIFNTGAAKNAVRNNLFRNNTRAGVEFSSSSGNQLAQNDISLNDTGVWLSGTSSSNLISKNNITGNNVGNLRNVTGIAQTWIRNWFGSVDSSVVGAKIADGNETAFVPYRLGLVDTAAGADTTAPKAPDTVAIIGIPSDTSIIVEWSAVTALEESNGGAVGLSGYRVYRSAIQDTSSWNKVAQTASGVIRWQDTDVLVGQRYFYRVTAFGAATFENESFFSDSQPSDSAAFTTTVNWYVNDASTVGDSFTSLAGSDVTGDGTKQKPFATVAKAFQFAGSGDSVIVDSGVYNLASNLTIGVANLSLIGVDSVSTILDRGDTATSTVYGIYATNLTGLTIKNLRVRKSWHGIYWNNVDYSTIDGVTVSDLGNVGFYNYTNCDFDTFRNNVAYKTNSVGFYFYTSTNNYVKGNTALQTNSGFYMVYSADRNVFVNNRAEKINGSYGFWSNQSDTNTFSDNVSFDNISNGFLLDGAQFCVVSHNTVDSNADYQISLINNGALYPRSNTVEKNNILPSAKFPDSGLINSSSAAGSFDFKRNWWGTSDSVAIKNKIMGVGRDAVVFSPWRLAVIDSAPDADTTAPKAPDTVGIIGSPSDTSIILEWSAVTVLEEPANGGAVGLSGYRIYRSTVKDTSSWIKLAQVASGIRYQDTEAALGVAYYYRVTAFDAAPFPNESFYSDSQPSDSAVAGPTVNWYVNDGSTTGDSFTSATGSDMAAGKGTASAPFASIPRAMQFATAGDTIWIDAGLYDSYVTVNGTETAGVNITLDSVALIGKDSNATVIDPPGPKTLASLYGVYVSNVTGLLIKNLGVTGAYEAIRMDNVDFSTVTGDSAGSIGNIGIYLISGSANNTISANTLNSNYTGIYLSSSSSNTLTNNSASSNSSNGIVLLSSSSNTISGNAANSNSSYGISLAFSTANTMTNNTANSNATGIDLGSTSTGNTLTGNTANSNSTYGIRISSSSTNTVTGGTVNNNAQAGIYVSGSDTGVIHQNDISGNDTGVWIDGASQNNVISKNNLTSNATNHVWNKVGLAQTLARNWFGTADSAAIASKVSDTSSAWQPFRLGVVDTTAGADTTAPRAPDTVAVIGQGASDTSVIIEWSAVTLGDEGTGGQGDLGGYRVYRSTVADTSSWIQVAQVSAAAIRYQDTDVMLGTNYYYRVTAYDTASPYINESFYGDSQPFDSAQMQSTVNWYVNDGSTAGDSFTYAAGSNTTGNGSASTPFATITKALSLATAGDTVWIDAGTYAETVVINADSITLIGKDSGATVIDPPGADTGIYASGKSYLLIRSIGVTGAYDGIVFDNVDYSRLDSDSASGNSNYGVVLRNGSDTNTIVNGIFNSNTSRGVVLWASYNDTVQSCDAASNGGVGIGVFSSGGGHTIMGNTANSNITAGIQIGAGIGGNLVKNNTITSSPNQGIYILNAPANTIVGNTVKGAQPGIEIAASRNVIRNNLIAQNSAGAGVYINGVADTNAVEQNEITGNETGVLVILQARNNVIQKNNITGNVWDLVNRGGLAQTTGRNWWGTADESAIFGKISDTANDFRPYRLGQIDTASGADTTAPAAPSGLTIDTAGQIKLTWVVPTLNEETNGGSVGYNGAFIYRLDNTPDTTHWANTVNLVRMAVSTETTWIDTGASDGNRYYYRLVSVDASTPANHSFFTDTVSAVADFSAPSASLSSPAAGLQTPNAVVALVWTAASDSSGIDTYVVMVSKIAAFTTLEFQDTVDGLVTGDTFTAASADTYYWRVRATDGAGNVGSYSATRGFLVDSSAGQAALSSPADGAQGAPANVSLFWAALSDSAGIDSYVVEISKSAVFAALEFADTVDGAATSDTGFTAGSEDTYFWRVRAIDVLGNVGANSAVRGFLVDWNAGQVTLSGPVDGSQRTNASVGLTWTALTDSAGIDSYAVEVSNSAVFATLEFTDTVDGTGVVGVGADTFTASSQDTYYWRVRAIDHVGNAGAYSATRGFLVDTTAGQVVLGLPSSGTVTSDTTPTLTWSVAADSAGIDSYVVEVSASAVFSSTAYADTLDGAVTNVTPTLDSNLYYWRVRAIDVLGNVGANSDSFTLRIDTGPASVTLLSPADAYETTGATIQFSWSGASIDTYTWELSQSAAFSVVIDSVVDTVGTSVVKTVAANDSYYWRVIGRNALGGEDTSAPRGIVVDNTAAQVTLTSPADASQTTNAVVVLAWSAVTDSVGIDSYVVEVSKSAGFTSTVVVDTVDGTVTSDTPAGLYNDTYYWRVRAVDALGNVGANSAARGYLVDSIAGQVVLSSPADGTQTASAIVGLTWTALTDSAGIDSYVVEVSNSAGFSAVVFADSVDGAVTTDTFTAPGADTYYWRVRAIDALGNEGANSTVRGFLVDTSAGQVVLSGPADGASVTNASVGLTWTALTDSAGIDSYAVEVSKSAVFATLEFTDTVDGTGVTGLGADTFTAASEDTYYWRVRAIDHVGNAGAYSAARSFLLDSTAPQVTLVSPLDGYIISDTTPAFTWSGVTDSVGIDSYAVEVSTSAVFASVAFADTVDGAVTTATAAALDSNIYYWRVRAIDGLGNMSANSDSFTFRLDTGPAAVTLVGPADGHETNVTSVLFEWMGASTDSYTWELSTSASFAALLDSVLNTTALSVVRTLPANDSYYWRVTGWNALGGADTSAPRGIVVDTAVAVSALASPANGYETNAAVAVAWTAASDSTGIDSYVVEASNDNFTTTAYSVTVDGIVTSDTIGVLGNDTYLWRVRAVDKLGNVGANSAARGILFDTTAPRVILVGPDSGTLTLDTTPLLTWQAAADSAGIGYYVIEVAPSDAFATTVFADTVGASQTSDTVLPLSGLSPDTYYWRVRAIDVLGNVGADTTPYKIVIDTEPGLTLTSPNGAEIWTVGETRTIAWTWQGTVSNVTLEYSTDSGAAFSNVIETSVTNTGSYAWCVPDDIGADVRMRVTDSGNPAVSDSSNANFAIRGGFTVAYPNGGDSFQAAAVETVTWTSTGTISSVKLEYSADSGTTWTVIDTSTPNTGTYAWTTPNAPTTQAKVRVLNADDPATADASNNVFRIWPVVVPAPAAAIVIVNGNHQLVSSSSACSAPLRVRVVDTGGTFGVQYAHVMFTVTRGDDVGAHLGETVGLTTTTAYTDIDGYVSETLTLGTNAGVYRVEAQCDSTTPAASVYFTAYADGRDIPDSSWRMMGVNKRLVVTTPSALLGGDLGAGTLIYEWQANANENGALNNTLYYAPGEIERGDAYWIKPGDAGAKTWIIDEGTQGVAGFDTVAIALDAGWNIISSGQYFYVDWSAPGAGVTRPWGVRVDTGLGITDTPTPTQLSGMIGVDTAHAAGVMSRILYWYDGSAYQWGPNTVSSPAGAIVAGSSSVDAVQMKPMVGFWVHADAACTLWVFPNPADVVETAGVILNQAPAYRADGQTNGRTDERLSAQYKQNGKTAKDNDWAIQIMATGAGKADAQNYVGVMPTANAARLAGVYEPPAAAGGYVALAVRNSSNESLRNETIGNEAVGNGQPNPGAWMAAAFSEPVTATDAKTAGRVWDVRVASDLGQPVTLTWDNIENLPGDYEAYIIGAPNGPVNLRRSSSLAFNFSLSNSHFPLTLVVGAPEFLAAHLAAPLAKEQTFAYPNPGPDGATGNVTFAYNLSAAGDVKIKIFDVGGRLVREISGTGAAGLNTLVWDTTNRYGQKVGSGVYIYKIDAGGNKLVDKLAIVR